ncbi:hypothetical protein E6H21_01880 [Candidatus Bathyarchaeota archaeon]|nr:MAG: hypothetical protein E6H21_01880 [Candidatus Bathyarchaeota archaeon]
MCSPPSTTICQSARAMDLILTGRIVNVEDAQSMGLVNAVTEPETLDVTVQDLTTKPAQSPSKAVAFSKSYWGRSVPKSAGIRSVYLYG